MKLTGKKVAILATDGFEEVELTRPLTELESAGAKVHIVSPNGGSIKSWNEDDWGESFQVDQALDEAKVTNFDLLVLPGGQINPDKLRTNDEAMQFIKDFHSAGKPIGAICHAPWLLIESGLAEGTKLTSFKSIRTDLKNAGANWVDQSVVIDKNIVTSRNPDDLDDFCQMLIDVTAKQREAATKGVS